MVWIQIILSIIGVVPAVIKLIREVIDMLHGHPAQAEHEHVFHQLLLDWRTHHDNGALITGLQSLRDTLAKGA